MHNPKKFNFPSVLIIMGATGDLMQRKIAPSLYYLFINQQLPAFFQVIGFARRPLTDEDFRSLVAISIRAKIPNLDGIKLAVFLKKFSYQDGNFDNLEDYSKLGKKLGFVDSQWKICANKLFYLAVPPQYYQNIFRHLKKSELTKPCSKLEGWTRILVEKPFGRDAKSAYDIDLLMSKLFKEEQIYRIDHYLAKEMLQSIINFRFSNNLFEPSWNNQQIEKININLIETLGVEDRGAFYDGVGALRDVGQNHLLQMLALVTMERPKSQNANDIRRNRLNILQTLRLPTKEEIVKTSYRGQYQGYLNIKGVNPKSKTETYFSLKSFLNSPRWQGIPIYFQSGKKFKNVEKNIIVTFKHQTPCLCPSNYHIKNQVIFSLEPSQQISIKFLTKKPGLKSDIEERTLDFFLYKKRISSQYVEEYAKLLLDAITGDQTLFVASLEVQTMWKYIDPIFRAWQNNLIPLNIYIPNRSSTLQLEKNDQALPKVLLKKIGMVGLGKMGENLSLRLIENNWQVFGFDKDRAKLNELSFLGIITFDQIKNLVGKLTPPRVVWLMLPAGKIIDKVLFDSKEGLVNYLAKDDIVIDGGNSYYQDTVNRAKKLKKYGIKLVDVGVSGGPQGARIGPSLMVGGDSNSQKLIEPLIQTLALTNGYKFFEGVGAGHFVKMIHNGIEYGMMQAIAEGFNILKNANYKLDLKSIAEIYNHGSVIESRLTGWLESAFNLYGDTLKNVSGSVAHTGEGEWTLKTAKMLKLKAKIIEESFKFRIKSKSQPDYTGKIISALRNQFGGHNIK